jgi:hypothetical protein
MKNIKIISIVNQKLNEDFSEDDLNEQVILTLEELISIIKECKKSKPKVNKEEVNNYIVI